MSQGTQENGRFSQVKATVGGYAQAAGKAVQVNVQEVGKRFAKLERGDQIKAAATSAVLVLGAVAALKYGIKGSWRVGRGIAAARRA